ncbi:radical SAM protein [bacterium]|nr:radical SAM protein [bacterium]
MKTGNSPKILLVTPPLTQINTPYPATAVLKGFLTSHNLNVFQVDLGLELFLELLRPEKIQKLFDVIRHEASRHTPDLLRILALEEVYLNTITPVVRFLQLKDPTLAHRIISEGFLPEGPRFHSLEDMDWAFGTLGIQDRAKFMATLYIEDIADLVREFLSGEFGFSRYAENLALSATHFQPIDEALQTPDSWIEQLMLECLDGHLTSENPDLVGFSIPFPGCLLGALKCGQYIRRHFPSVSIMFGGGYVNTELRTIKNPAVFKYTDFITLDDGESPSLQIVRYLTGEIDQSRLKRTFLLKDATVTFIDNPSVEEIPFSDTGVPDYSGLMLDQYLSIIEIANPMHRLWSDGRWNKLTLAHGCYWKKCAFCDISLDYISRYEPVQARKQVDNIQRIMDQTGQSGFHFVDEAAPPKLLKELSIEILKRGISITWWTNIRFENRFSKGLCQLMAAAGCIAVSGGLETASDRLLQKMNKGVSIAQAARTADNLQDAGIMVHAYLMYGFPTQTVQETIDALEVIRQFFLSGLIQSAFWHRFALTQHSAIGKDPERYGIEITGPTPGDFALNDLQFKDPLGADHDRFASGLNKAVYNYMYGIGLNYPINSWFDFKTPATTIDSGIIQTTILNSENKPKETSQLLWISCLPQLSPRNTGKKDKRSNTVGLFFNNRAESQEISASRLLCDWLTDQLSRISLATESRVTLQDWKQSYETGSGKDFSSFLQSDLWQVLLKNGLLVL